MAGVELLRSGAAEDGREDRDTVFASVDLPSEGLPGLVAGDEGGIGALGGDEQHVVGGVAGEAGGDRRPAVAGARVRL